jgi:hypothetical protein
MKPWKIGALLAALACAATPPTMRAAAAPGQEQGAQAAADMAALYQRLCLAAFPDPSAVGAALASLHAARVSPNETEGLLDGEPGSAWRIETATAQDILTIDDPPYNSCALLRITRDGFPTALPYIAAVQDYARRKSLAMGRVTSLDETLSSGATEQVLQTPLTPLRKPGRKSAAPDAPAESSMYITVDFHGHYTGWSADAAAGGTGVELRMEHHIAQP